MRRTSRILLCNPPQVVEQNLSKIWINWNGFSNVGVLLVYLAIYIIIRRRGRPPKGKREEWKKPLLIDTPDVRIMFMDDDDDTQAK